MKNLALSEDKKSSTQNPIYFHTITYGVEDRIVEMQWNFSFFFLSWGKIVRMRNDDEKTIDFCNPKSISAWKIGMILKIQQIDNKKEYFPLHPNVVNFSFVDNFDIS